MKIEKMMYNNCNSITVSQKLNEIIDYLNDQQSDYNEIRKSAFEAIEASKNYYQSLKDGPEPQIGDIWLDNENNKVYIQEMESRYDNYFIIQKSKGEDRLLSWVYTRSKLVKLIKRNTRFIHYTQLGGWLKECSYKDVLDKLKEELK